MCLQWAEDLCQLLLGDRLNHLVAEEQHLMLVEKRPQGIRQRAIDAVI